MIKKNATVLMVGRPNVGKSTLFNRLTQTKTAITAKEAGVTRDIRALPVQWNGQEFYLQDAGGVIFDKHNPKMQNKIEELVSAKLDSARLILFMVDGKDGVLSSDYQVAEYLRPYSDKVLMVMNKCDNETAREETQEAYKLGFGDPMPISCLQGWGVGDLCDEICKRVPTAEAPDEEAAKRQFRVSIVGRPNVGKSSLLNALLNDERAIVDDVAGTTRDAVEAYFRQGDNEYIFADTAGLRRQRKVNDVIEYFSRIRTDQCIEDSDLVIFVMDVYDPLVEQDKKILNMLFKMKRNILIFYNKWDLMERSSEHREQIYDWTIAQVPQLSHYPIHFGSATEKLGLGKIFATIPQIIESAGQRIDTGLLNQFIRQVLEKTPPSSRQGKRLKVYYATQAERFPPTIVFFVNHPKLLTPGYRRYLEREFRNLLGNVLGVAIRMKFRSKEAATEDRQKRRLG